MEVSSCLLTKNIRFSNKIIGRSFGVTFTCKHINENYGSGLKKDPLMSQ